MVKVGRAVALATLALAPVSAFAPLGSASSFRHSSSAPAVSAVQRAPLGVALRGDAPRQGVLGMRASAKEQEAARAVKAKVDEEKAKLAEMLAGAELKMEAAADTMSEKSEKKASKPVEASNQPKPYGNPDKSLPPRSFRMCVEQAYLSTKAAIDEGYKLMEVEFPPLPQNAMENEAVGWDVLLKAQIQHTRDFARLFEGKQVAIVFPDIVERNRFVEDVSFGKKKDGGGIRYAALGGGYKGNWIEQIWVKQEYVSPVQEDDDIIVVIGASAQELPDVRKLCEEAGDRPVVLFNLKLGTLRGDFGLPAFPPKSLHYEWLSSALPTYHVLPRAYSRTITRPPFLINYSGCLFRTYPGKWQVLLEVPDEQNGGGRYESVRLESERPALSEVREMLAQELQLDSLDTEEQKSQTFFGLDLATLRSGVVVKTWWEQDTDKTVSDNWRK